MSDIGRRCSPCGVSWPDHNDYATCPTCLEPTDLMSNLQPLGEAEAKSLKSRAEFDRFYVKWDAEREDREIAQLHSDLSEMDAA